MLSILSSKPKYSKIGDWEGDDETQSSPSSFQDRTRRIVKAIRLPQWVYMVLASAALISIGFALGQKHSRHDFFSLHLDTQKRVFEHIPVWGDRPSNQSDDLWNTLMPKRGGFFNHPEIAPERSAYAVFHQLHCLNALREAYWTALDASTSSVPIDIDTIPFEISPPHMRHCIDLLRQTLMCTPDLTVEVKNLELGGVTGFGTAHQCRNWSHLMEWMSEWEDIGAPKSPPASNGHEHNHHHHG